jgi:PDDEXK-like domain of unknown function (DUF3799)
MGTVCREPDGRVHFSSLKVIGESPAHYLHHLLLPARQTSAMRFGSLVDAMLFHTRSWVTFSGDRRSGQAWDKFLAAHPESLIVTSLEENAALTLCHAVDRDPVAGPILADAGADIQRVLQWDDWGLPCATGVHGSGRGGIDHLTDEYVTDLKVTRSSSPEVLRRHILTMGWHAQVAFYLGACQALGLRARRGRLICVEATPPHVVTVCELSAEMLELGRRSLSCWTERLKACEAANVWPGYVQEQTLIEPPAWASLGPVHDDLPEQE